MTTLFTPAPGTVRDKQTAAVKALAELLSHDLPALTWRIDPYATTEHLTAQLATLNDEESRQVIAEWAEFLGADVQEIAHDDYIQLEIRTVRIEDGMSIHIYGHLSVNYGFVKVTKAEAEGGAR